jgi:hypothetical protein
VNRQQYIAPFVHLLRPVLLPANARSKPLTWAFAVRMIAMCDAHIQGRQR